MRRSDATGSGTKHSTRVTWTVDSMATWLRRRNGPPPFWTNCATGIRNHRSPLNDAIRIMPSCMGTKAFDIRAATRRALPSAISPSSDGSSADAGSSSIAARRYCPQSSPAWYAMRITNKRKTTIRRNPNHHRSLFNLSLSFPQAVICINKKRHTRQNGRAMQDSRRGPPPQMDRD